MTKGLLPRLCWKRSLLGNSCKGEDLLVLLNDCDKRWVAKVTREKMTVTKLQKDYGENSTVYLWNKNLQAFPNRLSGRSLNMVAGCYD